MQRATSSCCLRIVNLANGYDTQSESTFGMIKRCIDTREVDEDEMRRSLLMKVLKDFFDG